MAKNELKEYLGDGAYVTDLGYALLLTTEDGISVRDRVELGTQELAVLIRFALKRGWIKIDVGTT